MSLVLDALRRVEKADAHPGSVGVAVASYRPLRRPHRSWAPLLLGLIVGGVAVLLFGPSAGRLGTGEALPAGSAGTAASNGRPARALGGAGLPPPLILDATAAAVGPQSPSDAREPAATRRSPTSPRLDSVAPAEPVAAVSRGLVLQAISERDSHAIAVISDQLVKEGDLIGKARVLKIGVDTVEVLLEGGRRELIRFQAPPDPTPTPDGP